MTFALPILAVAGPALGAVGSVLGGVAALGQGLYQHSVSKQQAAALRERGEMEAEEKRRQALRLEASQRVGFAGSGVALTSLTALDVVGQSARDGAFDAAMSRYSANISAANALAQGRQARAQGILSFASGVFNAGGEAWKAMGSYDKAVANQEKVAAPRESLPAKAKPALFTSKSPWTNSSAYEQAGIVGRAR